MKPEPMTADECLTWLAEREKECDHPAALLAWDIPIARRGCDDCHGTGRVAMFPTLRGECPACGGSGRDEVDFGCSTCGGGQTTSGRGWVVAGVHLEDVLAIALHLRGVASVMFTLTDDGLTACYIWGKTSPHEPMGHAKAKTSVSATLRALVAAYKAQEEAQSGR